MNPVLNSLQSKLAYDFKRPALLEMALTHRSAGKRNNERLEFLGDGVLNLLVAHLLFERFPAATEGQLSRLRANLVNGTILAELARQLELGGCLSLGSGERKSGGHRRDSILAGALEAVIGAMYLDGGFIAVQRWVTALYADRINGLNPDDVLKDPKTRLQEYLQGRGQALPEYRLVATEGEAHNQRFTVSCKVVGLEEEVIGRGRSRRAAEQQAACKTLDLLTGAS
ncbi:MAG TPA: ribonuclease III [Gammaproteobacteria bacterium]|nr:ribonuclease III [Gammaproteobacteria bacterium]